MNPFLFLQKIITKKPPVDRKLLKTHGRQNMNECIQSIDSMPLTVNWNFYILQVIC